MAKLRTQPERRRGQNFLDQHDRPWWATIEIASGESTGGFVPGPWHTVGGARLLPVPMKYVATVPGELGRIAVNYEQWIADYKEASDDYRRTAIDIGRREHKEQFDPTNPFTATVVSIIGKPPMSVEPILAMRQGNPWMLGFTDEVDERVKRYLPVEMTQDEPDFRPKPAKPVKVSA